MYKLAVRVSKQAGQHYGNQLGWGQSVKMIRGTKNKMQGFAGKCKVVFGRQENCFANWAM